MTLDEYLACLPARQPADGIVDLDGGDLVLPIVGGPWDGHHMHWHPPDGPTKQFNVPGAPPHAAGTYYIGYAPRTRARCWWWQAA